MRQRQVSAAFRSLACQSRTSVPTRSRRSTLPAAQVARKRTLLALGATNVGGSPPTSAQGRSSKPDATFHPARSAAQAAKPISRDPPRLPRDRHRPSTVSGERLLPGTPVRGKPVTRTGLQAEGFLQASSAVSRPRPALEPDGVLRPDRYFGSQASRHHWPTGNRRVC